MKKIMLTLLALCALVPADARKKAKPQPLLFPDGTVVPEWFKDATVPAIETLGKQYNIADYGAISDPLHVQTELIQSVIDKAAEEGGGVVVIPEGIYKSGSLFFKQGTHLYLSRGAVLLGSEFIHDFPVITTRIEGELCKYFGALINVDGLDGFTLSGPGTVDGNGSPYWKAFRIRRQWNPKCTNKDEQRPRLLHVSNSRNVTIADATLQNSPFWTCHVYKTDHIKLLNLRVFSPVAPIKSASADGIDLDVCTNVHVKGCRITVNDDGICFKGGKGPWADKDENNGPNSNILVEECFFDRTTGSCVTCGSECIQTHNILIRNCKVDRGQSLLQLKMRPDTPQHYEYITIDGVEGSCRCVLSVAPWTQFFDLKDRKDIPRSYGEHIIFRNLNLECKSFANIRPKPEEFSLDDFTFENVRVSTPQPEWESLAISNLKIINTFINEIKQ